jgi:hypothetical protein
VRCFMIGPRIQTLQRASTGRRWHLLCKALELLWNYPASGATACKQGTYRSLGWLRKKRSISALASGPVGSVKEPSALPPAQA